MSASQKPLTVTVRISKERAPNELSRYASLESYEVDVPLDPKASTHHASMADLYGLEIDAYVSKELHYHGYLFEIEDLLHIVVPPDLGYTGVKRARFLFAAALDSGGDWSDGEGWCEPEDQSYTTPHAENEWRSEIDAWLDDFGEKDEATRRRWHEAVDHALADRVRELGILVRALTTAWGLDEEEADHG